jgi:ankyrin repeat protein
MYDPQTDITSYVITAARRQLPNLDVLRVLVEKFNADVNIQVGGTSALHILASGTHWWHTEGLKYLLQYGANVELKNEYDQTPLHIAVSRSCGSYRSREVAKLLLEHGSNPDAKDSNGMTCLNNSMHDIGFVRLLIKHGADINLGDHPALFSSITTQDSSAVAMLLEAGADCNVRQKAVDKPKPLRPQVQERIQSHEYYPVHYAASTKFNTPKMRETAIQIVKLLLDNGADPFLNFRDDATIIHDVFEYGGILQPFLDIPNLDLERRDAKGRTLLLAAARSRFGTFSPSNFPHVPSFRGGMGWKELEAEQAKYKIGDPSPAQTIYDKGGDLLAVDNKGNNTIHFLTLAIPHNFDEYQKTFSLFIERAPSLVHQKNAEGWKPFHLAIKDRKTWVIESLINAGADPLERDPEGNTPLHHLASNMSQFDAETEWLAWWEKFVALGIPINAKNDRGETPVFEYFRGGRYYCENNHRKHFTPFEEAGADPFARNNEGETLLHIVATKAFTPGMWTTPEPDTADTFRFLMEKGLDPMAEDNSQRTALVSSSRDLLRGNY